MTKKFFNGYMWDSDATGLNLKRENKYGTVYRSELYPGGPYEERFVPKDPDLYPKPRLSAKPADSDRQPCQPENPAEADARAPRRTGGGMRKLT